MVVDSYPLSASDGRPPCPSSSRPLSPLQIFLDPPLRCMFIGSSCPKVLMLRVVSIALRPILNSNKKIA